MISNHVDFKLKQEFINSDAEREEVLTRSERYAGWTIPTLFPDNNLTTEEMQNDYQSVGAQAVTNLANKVMMALFQPTRPFFRMQLNEEQREEVRKATNMTEAQIDASLASTEREAMRKMNESKARVVLNDVVQQLIVVGNSLLYTPKDDEVIAYSLRDYITKRDLRGKVYKTIICETKTVASLSEDLASIAVAAGYHNDDEISIYTGIERQTGGKFKVWQELEDVCRCNKRDGIYAEDALPWIPLTWKLARGKDYGTGLVEDYAGDFHTLSTLAEAILDYTTVVTDVKNLVNPAGMTDVREITEAPSGAYVSGREEDLHVHTANVVDASQFLDMRFKAVERRIGAAFLLNTAVTRDAERVTAEEIRMQAQELESSLGGVYSRLALELQKPYAKRLLRSISLEFKDIEPVIVTGLESLSRNSDLGNLRAFLTDLAILEQLPESVQARIKVGDLIAMFGAGHGVDYEKFLKDEEVVKKEMQEAAERQAAARGMEAQAVKQAEGNKG